MSGVQRIRNLNGEVQQSIDIRECFLSINCLPRLRPSRYCMEMEEFPVVLAGDFVQIVPDIRMVQHRGSACLAVSDARSLSK